MCVRRSHSLTDDIVLPCVQDRVLSRPGGSMLLVGDSGVGRRQSVALVAFMHHMTLQTPAVTMDYSEKVCIG